MNGDEHELLRRLADADAHLPPPAGEHSLTPERFAALVASRQHRRWCGAAAVTVAAASIALWMLPTWPRGSATAARADTEPVHTVDPRRLAADLERLRQRIAALPDRSTPSAAYAQQQLAAQLRFELATARADALTQLQTPRPPEFR